MNSSVEFFFCVGLWLLKVDASIRSVIDDTIVVVSIGAKNDVKLQNIYYMLIEKLKLLS